MYDYLSKHVQYTHCCTDLGAKDVGYEKVDSTRLDLTPLADAYGG
jgi:hypothetical protein